MREYFDDGRAVYPIDYRDKEFIFSIDRSGLGFCQCKTDVTVALQREDKNSLIKALVFRNRKATNRMLALEEEFSVDVKLPELLARLIWESRDEVDLDDQNAGVATDASRKRESEIDEALSIVIEKNYYNNEL